MRRAVGRATRPRARDLHRARRSRTTPQLARAVPRSWTYRSWPPSLSSHVAPSPSSGAHRIMPPPRRPARRRGGTPEAATTRLEQLDDPWSSVVRGFVRWRSARTSVAAWQRLRSNDAGGADDVGDTGRHPVPGGDPRVVRDLAAHLRRPRRADRGDAPRARRGTTVDRGAAVPARAVVLHPAPRPGSAAARDLPRLAAERDRRRHRRRRAVRAPGLRRAR